MTRTVDSRINQYLYLLDRNWNCLDTDEQLHVRQGMRQGILQNVTGTIRLTETAEAQRPTHNGRFWA